MILLVGLGNPGDKYHNNRHNIGFKAVDEIVYRFNFSSFKNKFQGQVAEGLISGTRILAFKPSTYMNNSGQAVREISKFYKIELSDIIVFHDELDIQFAKIKVKMGGGAGGHNGLKSIDAHIGKDYMRVRIGIDHPGDRDYVSEYVLSDFSKTEAQKLQDLLEIICNNIEFLLSKDQDLFMNRVAIQNQ
jgi:PTH1 family peptidyl-tRNA hydrolase